MLPICVSYSSASKTRAAFPKATGVNRELISMAILVILFMVSLIDITLGADRADPRIAPGGITLKQALEKGLKARRPSEFAFIKLVVKKVEQGQLSSKMVERTFLWARNNKQPYPMPYFERALQIQAKKLGVELPFTDT